MKKIRKAIDYATKKHQGQIRKTDQIPYISHPFAVGMLLLHEGYNEDTVVAGLLHDVVEDTDGTLKEIRDLFGPYVAELVEYASEPDKTLPWEERKQHTIETIKNAPLDAKLVVCADKIDNLSSAIEKEKLMGEEMWASFKRGKESQKWYYSQVYVSLLHGIEKEKIPNLFIKLGKLLNDF
ncbi:HD domain-containing protein [Bacillaceae bacterium S4-13-56]